MLVNGEAQKDAIRPDFNKSIFIDFAGVKITADAGFLLMGKLTSDSASSKADATTWWMKGPLLTRSIRSSR